jgi:hypothetical protein
MNAIRIYRLLAAAFVGMSLNACAIKSSQLVREEEQKRERLAAAPEATCWQRAMGFRTSRAMSHAVAPEPEALAFAGPLNIIIIPGVGLTRLIAGIFTVPYDLVALPFRCHGKRETAKTDMSQQ